ncbi:phosphotransferase family protein [Yinghuangia sp. ASG 101]|uniref:phosphotransferase family protein n=1 Tax=Yinghuangia sp. ASG 101 TaxID=2896848 RepID=UPI001E605911|nr:phosphotransferase family protein [Yinghuangia sp. ASG 101]UGQ11602.1 phosphotransferase family protein [Yinghuangia sp. ASG 101]
MSDLDLIGFGRLLSWLDENGISSGPLSDVEQLSGGTQNILVRFTRGGRSYVLRRPPRYKRDTSDEAMRREAAVLAGLAGSDVPHPRLVGLCTDQDVLGCVFLVMEGVSGFTATTSVPEPVASSAALQRAMGLSMVDALAALGRVDPAGAGLSGLGRPEGWLERQVPRWRAQLESYQTLRGWPGPDLPGLDDVADWLDANRPARWRPGLVHGDFHLGNVMFDPATGTVSAVVDWELATQGDPLLDLGHLLASWPDPDEPRKRGAAVPLPGLPGRDELVARYAEGSDRDLAHVDWYHVLACFRLGIILEGTHARARAGKAPRDIGERLHLTAQALFEGALRVIGGPTRPTGR